jgi:hypothetical protein
MSNHEYFQELSALSAIGQLSSQEDRELAEHLRECASCTDVHLEYARVIQQQLPQADVIRWRMKSAFPAPVLDEELRPRFLARARADGIEFSPEAERSLVAKSSRSWWVLQMRPALAVANAAVLAVVVTWTIHGHRLTPPSVTATVDTYSSELAHENDVLRAQLETLHQTIGDETAKVDQLRKEMALAVSSQQRLQAQAEEARQQQEKVSALLQKTETEKIELANSSQAENSTIATLRNQIDSLYREQAEILSSRVLLEAQVRELNASIQDKSTDLERERQLMAVSKDVRQLMGARNLHILDVRDVGGGGKDAKAFGRVFYAEGQSLVFYAFDLPNGGLNPAKYTFQAWGQREAGPQAVRNLGTFEVDDHEQSRWVLKVNNPALLAGIDSVFVTSESLRDSKEPRGRKLMYAYIAGQPNHP